MEAADHAQSLQGQVEGLLVKQIELKAHVCQRLDLAIAQEGFAPLTDLPDPSQLSDLVNNLAALSYFRAYVEELKKLVEITRSIERSIRSLEGITADSDAAKTSQPWLEVVHLYNTAAYHQSTLTSYATAIPPVPQLQQHAEHASQRLQAAVDWAHNTLKFLIANNLQQCGWPPTITSQQQAAIPWHHHPQQLAALQHLLMALTAFQQVQQQLEFAAIAAGDTASVMASPLLWATEAFAAPVEEKLTAMFANDTALGALDRPEWLLDAVARIAEQQSSGMLAFQGVLQACNLDAHMSFPLQFARSMRQVAANILVKHKLPALTELTRSNPDTPHSSALWMHLMQSLIDFETKLAPLLGIIVPDKAAPPDSLFEGSSVDCVCSNAEWLQAWLQAEQSSISDELDAVLYTDTAWQPVHHEEGEEGQQAWQQEFYPPAGVEKVAAMLRGLWRRLDTLPSGQARSHFLRHVVGDLVKLTYGRMLRTTKQAEVFNDLASAEWAVKICSCVNGAHYLEYHLKEELDHLTVPQLQQQQQQRELADAIRELERQAAELGALRREWSVRLGKAVVQQFSRMCASYQRQLTALAGSPAVPDADLSVSASFVAPLEYLASELQLLARYLDLDCFRYIWRMIAHALSVSLYNEVASEARFSRHGAAQFTADCNALVSVFRAYSPKPRVHFRELLECCQLLSMSKAEEVALADEMKEVSEHEEALRVLAGFGVSQLRVEQVAVLMRQRL